MCAHSPASEAWTDKDRRYLASLAKQFPTIDSAITEIINLRAILALPKGTEHFVSDIHGEYEGFLHVLRTASGVIRRKIDDVFGESLTSDEKRSLATLIYYPEQKLEELAQRGPLTDAWYRDTLHRLTRVCRLVTSKYTRSKVRKALPKQFGYIIDELIHEDGSAPDKAGYCDEIVNAIIGTGKANALITAISHFTQAMAVDRLHILGDIFDRGPGADIILDKIMDHHSVDIQWGNHDILWMGAAAGSLACIATALRISLRYGNLDMLREGYGIDTSALAAFAIEFYGDDPCHLFQPGVTDENLTEKERLLTARMHKAITIMEFKLVDQLIRRRPEFGMTERAVLDGLNLAENAARIGGKTWSIRDSRLPTVNPRDPSALTPEEERVMTRLCAAFQNSEKLQKHMRLLFEKGGMYLCCNGNLLFHGCIPMNPDGSFQEFHLSGSPLKGKALLDWFDAAVRQGYFSRDAVERARGQDVMWYLWAGCDSPLFGKKRMTTFERYFIDEKETHHEPKNAYFDFRDDPTACGRILSEFGLNPHRGHIINGHVPVKVKKGESPVKAGGRLLVIDGGFAKAYQKETGIAGYTLIFSSRGMSLAAHHPFESTRKAIAEELDVIPQRFVVEANQESMRIRDTDIGRELRAQIENLTTLIGAYEAGFVRGPA